MTESDKKMVTEKDRINAISLFNKILPASNQHSAFARERKMEAIFSIEEALATERAKAQKEVLGSARTLALAQKKAINLIKASWADGEHPGWMAVNILDDALAAFNKRWGKGE